MMTCLIHGELQPKKGIQTYWAKGEVCPKCFPDYNGVSKEDIIEMQKIDADCNDCKHFKRGEFVRLVALKAFDGHCMKFNKPTRAYPVQYTGHECFEHRAM